VCVYGKNDKKGPLLKKQYIFRIIFPLTYTHKSSVDSDHNISKVWTIDNNHNPIMQREDVFLLEEYFNVDYNTDISKFIGALDANKADDKTLQQALYEKLMHKYYLVSKSHVPDHIARHLEELEKSKNFRLA